jgi:hypothetical protein
MMKRATLGTLAILAALALGPSLKADTFDSFYVPSAIAGLPATFTLPSSVTVGGDAEDFLNISDIPVSIDGTTVDFGMQFIPEDARSPDAGNVLMKCTDAFIFCQFSPSIGTTFADGNFGPFYTLSNGQMTFIPGVYGLVTISDSVPTPEPATLLLTAAGLAALAFFRRRFPQRMRPLPSRA